MNKKKLVKFIISFSIARKIAYLAIFVSAMFLSSCIVIDEEVHFCSDAERNVEVCTMEYNPVCGWFNSDVECDSLPCAITASNPCEACKNPDVEFWTSGECPDDSTL